MLVLANITCTTRMISNDKSFRLGLATVRGKIRSHAIVILRGTST